MAAGEWSVVYFVRLNEAGKEEETKFTEMQNVEEPTARKAYADLSLQKRLERFSKTNDQFGAVVGVGKRLLKKDAEQEKEYLAAPAGK